MRSRLGFWPRRRPWIFCVAHDEASDMSPASKSDQLAAPPAVMAQPPREITWQSVTGAFLISSLVAGSYPYVVLKLGMGPNVSVVSAFLGAIFLNLTAYNTRGQNRYLNNIIQTAGT